MILKGYKMSELTQERINFIELLHASFFKTKGYGAFAYISVSDALSLFDGYLDSNEAASFFINRYVRSV